VIRPGIIGSGAAPLVPVNTGAPVVSGTLSPGNNLSCTTGTWTNTPNSYAYQWQRSADGIGGWSNIGANANTYAVQAGDVGFYIRCLVTASNGLGPGAPAASNVVGPIVAASLLLDGLANPPVRAYALRRVRTAYTGPLIRVRRSSDNAELNIGYDGSNELDTAALLAHCGAGNGFVTVWYDQMGNSDASQGTAAAQPQIVTGGALTTTANSRPLWRQSATQALWIVLSTTTTFAISYAHRWQSGAGGRILTDGAGGGICFGWQSSQYMRANLGAAFNFAQANQDTNMHVMSMRATAGTLNVGYKDGVSQTPDNAGAVSAWTDVATNGTPAGTGVVSDLGEIYLWGAAANADLTTVDANIKTRFAIA